MRSKSTITNTKPVAVNLTATEPFCLEVDMSQITAFNYEGISLKESLWVNGQPYFTRRAIGEWLEAEQPHQYIRKIVERNPHILEFATVVNLGTVEGSRKVTRKVEVYDPIGLQLIINKSDLPKAITFQIAAAKLVIAYTKGELKPSKWTLKDDLMSAVQQIKSLPRGVKRADLVRDLAERDGITLQTAYRRIGLATGENFNNTKGKPIQRADKGTTKYPGEKEKVLAYTKINPTARGAAVKREFNLQTSYDRINVWIREASK